MSSYFVWSWAHGAAPEMGLLQGKASLPQKRSLLQELAWGEGSPVSPARMDTMAPCPPGTDHTHQPVTCSADGLPCITSPRGARRAGGGGGGNWPTAPQKT